MELAKIQLVNQRIVESIFKINKEFESSENSPLEYRFGAKVDVGFNEEKNDEGLVTLTFEVFPEAEELSKEEPYYLKTVIEGIFVWDDKMPETTRDVLLRQNAPAILLSYIRSSISIMTISGGFEPLVLPLLNFRTDN